MTNTYGIGYNPPGIEIAFALETFEDLFGEISINSWVTILR